MYASDLFKQFQKIILSNADKKDIDYIKEKYANTEIFDITKIVSEKIEVSIDEFRKTLSFTLPLNFFSMPFENCFIKVFDEKEEELTVETCLFIREYSPNILTGCFLYKDVLMGNLIAGTIPFTINLNDSSTNVLVNRKSYDTIINQIKNYSYYESNKVEKQMGSTIKNLMNLKEFEKAESLKLYKEELKNRYKGLYDTSQKLFEGNLIESLIKVQKVFEQLSKHEILVDNTKETEYYSFKNKKPTIKVTNRPIYYVLDKKTYECKKYDIKPITKLEYSHAFKVRGHWRRIDGIGKDRNGNYHIENYTWVIDHVRGQGELVKRVRIVKG